MYTIGVVGDLQHALKCLLPLGDVCCAALLDDASGNLSIGRLCHGYKKMGNAARLVLWQVDRLL